LFGKEEVLEKSPLFWLEDQKKKNLGYRTRKIHFRLSGRREEDGNYGSRNGSKNANGQTLGG